MPEAIVNPGAQGGDPNPVEEAKPEAKTAEAKPESAKPDPEVENLKAENERAKRYIVAMARKLGELSERTAGGGDVEDEDPKERAKKIREALDDDPERVLDEHFEARMRPMREQELSRSAMLNKKQEIAELKEKFGAERVGAYMKEMEEFMDGMQPRTRAQPGAWVEAFKYVRAEHFDDEVENEVKRRVNREDETQAEGASPGSGGRAAPRFNSLQKHVMDAFGMDEKDWIKYGGAKDDGYFAGPED